MRYALRSLLRQPLFTFSAIATLALGIGVNSTIFTFANAALFRGLAGIAEPERLAWVSSVSRLGGRETGMSYPEFVDYREATRDVFADLFAFAPTPLSVAGDGEPRRIRGHVVTGTYFQALGVSSVVGRVITPDDDRPGAPAVAVVSHRLWTDRFGALPDVLTSTIFLNGRPFAVVGVAPEQFTGPALGHAADVWVPMGLMTELRTTDRNVLINRGSSWLFVMGRLRDNVTTARARLAVRAVAERLEHTYPEINANRSATVSSAESGLPPESRDEFIPLSVLLLTVTGVVLMIACANVANLLLARGAGRFFEMSIRVAIGATRWRLLRQQLTESVVLAVVGAAAGLILSFWASDLLFANLPEAEFRGLSPRVDLRVLLFTATLASVSICTFGLLPALVTTRGALSARLRETAAAGGRTRLQGAFVVAQLSLSLLLLLAGGLSLRALQKSHTVDLGFTSTGVLTGSYDLELQNYSAAERIAFRRELRARLVPLPGVTAVGLANMAPLSGTMVSTVVQSSDSAGRIVESRAYLNAAGAGYFEALQIPILRGRGFMEADGPSSTRVAVVNELLARRLWGSADPIGREVTIGETRVQVVGVARNAKYDEPTEDTRPFLYTSLDQLPQLDRETVVVRTASAPALLASPLRSVLNTLDARLPVFDLRPFEDVLRERSDRARAMSVLLGAFGAMALLLAALGLYGVMAYAVNRRAREIGIRVALGAMPSEISSLIAADGLRLSLIGVAIGAPLSLPMGYALGALLFGVAIADLAAYALICAGLVAVAIVASVLPARRAARMDPVTVLRAE